MKHFLSPRSWMLRSSVMAWPGGPFRIFLPILVVLLWIPALTAAPDTTPSPPPAPVSDPAPPSPVVPPSDTMAEEVAPVSLSMEEAVEEGSRRNLTILAGRYNIDMARADQLQASFRRNPYFSAQASLNPFGGSWTADSSGGPRQIDLSLAVPLDTSGKRSALMDVTRTQTAISEAMFADLLRQTSRDIRLACVELMLADQYVRLNDERETSLRRLVTTIENRIGAPGLQPLLFSRAKLAAENAANEAQIQRQRLREARRDLGRLIGLEKDRAVHLTSGLRQFEFEPMKPADELIAEAYDHRPDLVAAQLGLKLAKSRRDYAEANVWDDLSLLLGLTYQGGVAAGALDPYLATNDPFYLAQRSGLKGARSFDFGVTIPIPVANRNQGEIQKADLFREQAGLFIRDTKIGIDREIRSDRERLTLYERQIRTYESGQLQRATQVREVQQRIFGTGGSNLLEYFDAMEAYHETLSAYYDAVAGYRRARIALESAKGVMR